MKQKFFLPALLTLAVFTASAQKITLGIRGGISIPNLSANGSVNNPLNTGYSSRTGPDFAAFLKYHLSDNFSIQPMLEYSAQGGKKNGFQALPTPAELAPLFDPGPVPLYLYADYNSTAKINYLMIPVLGRFDWPLAKKSPCSFYAAAGPFAGFLLSAKQVTSGSSLLYLDPGGTQPLPAPANSFDATTDIKDQLHTMNFGLCATVGFSYSFGNNSIFVEGGGNYGLLNIQKGTDNGKNQTGAAVVGVGYSYTLSKSKSSGKK